MARITFIVVDLALLAVLLVVLGMLIYLLWRDDGQYRRWLEAEKMRRVPSDEADRVVPSRRTVGFGPADEEFAVPGVQEAQRLDALREAPGRGSEPDFQRHDPPFV